MILTKAPYRVSLFGGGSDYTNFIMHHGIGMCIGFAIDKYSYVGVRDLPPFFNYKTRVAYSEIETVQDNNDIKHKGVKYTLIRMGMCTRSLEITHSSDLPAKTGLGTSSSFIVALIAALDPLRFTYKDKMKPSLLAPLASDVEASYSFVGRQDHYFAAIGGCAEMCFHGSQENGIYKTDYLRYPDHITETFEKHGLLFYTGIDRVSSDIVQSYINDLHSNLYQKKILDIAGKISLAIARNKITLEKFGEALCDTWSCKRMISPNISNERIDDIYNAALLRGALGGKLLGGGAGGCLFFLALPKDHDSIIKACQKEGCIHIPYKISPVGCERII